MSHERIHSTRLMTAIKTPYQPNGEIDLDAYDRLAEAQLQAGVAGFIVAGTTGEGHLMDWEEELMLIAHTVDRFGDRAVVVGNTGSNNTREAEKATRYGFSVGMHASLQINPYYGKTSEPGLRAHFQRVLDLGPAIIYNVPSRTGQDLPPHLIQDLAQHPNLLGVKECAGNERMGAYENQGIACWSGNDDQCFEGIHRYRSHGVISVAGNVVPGLMRKLMDEDNSELDVRLQSLFAWLFHVPSPNALNTLLAMLGMAQPVFRLPYVPLSQAAREEGARIMESLGSEHWVGSELNIMKDEDFLIV
jgi:4-hydroxy-tetrahydrodipicolinate synthase